MKCSWQTFLSPLKGQCPQYALIGLSQTTRLTGGFDCGFCHFSIVLVDYDLVEAIVYDAVCLVALAVKGFLVYVFVYIRCTPAAHFHGIFLWYIQHGSRTCKDMSAIMKANILNTVVSEQSLESLSDGIGFDRNNVVCLFLVWDCLN